MQKVKYEEADIEIIEFSIAYSTTVRLSGVSKGDNTADQDLGEWLNLSNP